MAKKQSMKNQRLAEEVLSMERGLAAPFIAANPIRSLPGVIRIKLMEKMSKPKKMNMGGVVPGRGGRFKGTR